MGTTFKSKFIFCSDVNNGHGWLYPNEIALGSNVITLELLIHEINEVELQDLFVQLDIDPNIKIFHNKFRMIKYQGDIMRFFSTGKVDAVSHLLSPFGYKTFINSNEDLRSGEQLLNP